MGAERPRRWPLPLAAAVAFALLTVAWLWPWPAMLGDHLARSPYWWDAQLNGYILREAQQNLLHQPWLPLDGRILHPHADVLAWSENLLSLAALGLPMLWAPPMLLHNLFVVFGVAATGFLTWLYLRPRCRSATAAFAGALLFAYAPVHLGLLSRIQFAFMPLVPGILLAFERALLRPTLRRQGLVAGLWLIQLGVGIYFAVHLLVLLLPVALWQVFRRPSLRRPPVLLRTAGVLLASAALAWLVFGAYGGLSGRMGFVRSEGVLRGSSGLLADLGTSSDFMVHWRSHAWKVRETSAREPISFPGATLLGLALVGLGAWAWGSLRSGRDGAPAAGAPPERGEPPPFLFGPGTHLFWLLLCFLLFLGVGPDAPGGESASLYGLLIKVFPPLRGLRYASRFAVPMTLALSAFAAWGAAAVERGAFWPRARFRPGAAGGLLLAGLGFFELWTVPLPLRAHERVEEVYDRLAADPGAEALLELPFDGRLHEPRVLRDLASLRHGLYTLGGYTGYDPPLLRVIQDLVPRFPDPVSHGLLRALGVDRVLVHRHALSPRERGRLDRAIPGARWLRAIYEDRAHGIYEIGDVPEGRAVEIRRRVRAADHPGLRPAHAVPRRALSWAGGLNPEAFPRAVDGDPKTRWTTKRPQRAGQLWMEIRLDRPREITALWLDARGDPADLPRGVRVLGQEPSGAWRTLYEETPHLPVAALLASPGESADVLRFPPARVQAIRLVSTLPTVGLWGSVHELWIEERAR